MYCELRNITSQWKWFIESAWSCSASWKPQEDSTTQGQIGALAEHFKCYFSSLFDFIKTQRNLCYCVYKTLPVIIFHLFALIGKTTLTESLKDALGATLLRSPPQFLSPWRARFDQEPPLIRRAFYALGNYITAEQISQEGMKAPVVVDRWEMRCGWWCGGLLFCSSLRSCGSHWDQDLDYSIFNTTLIIRWNTFWAAPPFGGRSKLQQPPWLKQNSKLNQVRFTQ